MSEQLGRKISAMIPKSRIPDEVMSAELERVRQALPHVHLQQRLTRGEVERLKADYDFIVIAVGAQKPRRLPIPGAERMIPALDFLRLSKRGKLWVGTRLGGLNHFDPQSGKFIRYQFDPQDPASLSDNHINTLLVDKDGTLWVGTTKGLDRFDPETNSFTRYQHNADQPKSLSGTIVTAIYQDGRGHYWVGTADAGLNSFDAKSGEFASFQSNADDPRTLSNNHVTAIEEDANGTLWVGTTGGLNQLSPSANIFTRYMESDAPLDLADDMVYSLLTDRTGNLWIGTANGLDRMNKSASYFIHYYNDPAFAGSLSNNTILSIFEDRGGVLWFGACGSGVNKYMIASAN